jgi:predicted ATP-grasp superfamily ATP-dependent carboligase
MVKCAEKAAGRSGCIGSVGIDFVAGDDEVYAIEINPRFQGTLDTVEAAISKNLFLLHVDACRGVIPGEMPPAGQYAARRILFAECHLTVLSDLAPLVPVVSDIPWPGETFGPGEAVVSVHGNGPDRKAALAALDRNMNTVRQYMAGWANGGNSRKSSN